MAKIENLRFHDLRHTFATRMVNSGVDLILVKEILGHSDIRTTVRYAHAVTEQSLDAIESVSHYAEKNKKVIKLQCKDTL